ncbi:MAG: leucine dehydrogenase [Flavobacteriales bacterium]|nr:leucine dehydrogenase [Flavobacteriales bacterium]|tara:strand:- start:33016 stop:34107 length:1092 start_codon:yes stop_codon:yes gene_type:complete
MKIADTYKKAKNNGLVLSNMTLMEHEQVVFCQDSETGLKAIIAIHNTTLGPALGGTRMWNYDNEYDALNDVLRLSRGMSLKAAISGLDLGGGKAVIIGDSNTQKTEVLMRKFGQYVESLGGKYITAEDVGMNTKDMEYVRMETKHVTGIPESMGGSGDPSPFTAFGVYMGMKASAKYKWGNDSLEGRTVVVQGVGHVGENLVRHLSEEKANIIINDIDDRRLDALSEDYAVRIVRGDSIFDLDMDIYAPCALGATVNPDTLNRLKCKIIAGAANNQLADEVRDSQTCSDKGIVYAPDFLINAGGLINVYSEIKGYDRESSMNQTREIYNTTLEILKKAELDSITTHVAALEIAEQRIKNRKSS